MDDDIFKDMIDYGDDINDMPPQTNDMPEEAITAEEPVTEESVPQEIMPEEPVYEYVTDYYNNGDDDEPEEMSYDYIYDEHTSDEKLATPMIIPLLKWLVPLGVILAMIVVIMTSDNSLIKSYRDNFGTNVQKLFANTGKNKTEQNSGSGVYEAEEKKAAPQKFRDQVEREVMISFDEAENAKFVKYKDGVVCAKTNYLCYISSEGKKLWEKNMVITDPILKSEGNYFLVAQKGGTRFALYNGEKAVFEKNSENNILTGNVSSNGDAVLVLDKPGYKGAIAVYNKSGDNAFSWSSGTSSIIAADISPKSRRVAAAMLNVDNTVRSAVYLFDIKKSDSYVQQSFDNAIAYDVNFKNDDLTVFTDTAMIGMKISGDMKYKINFGVSEPVCCDVSDKNDVLGVFTGGNIPMINIYGANGKFKGSIATESVPEYAFFNEDFVIYSIDRVIYTSKANMQVPFKYTSVMDIKGIIPISQRCFMVVYSNSISIVKMRGLI